MPYNLSVAKKEINKTLSAGTFTEYEATFLRSLVKQITDIEKSVHDAFQQKMDASLTPEQLTRQFKENTGNAHRVCFKGTSDLLDKMKKTYDGGSPVINKQMNTFLQSLLPHVEAVVEQSNSMNSSKISHYLDNNADIYLYCKALGGYFLPMSQSLDPLVGKLESSNPRERFKDDEGKCDGFVKQGRDMIQATGTPEYFPITHEHTQYHMDAQALISVNFDALRNMKVMDLSVNEMDALKKYTEKAMEKMQNEKVYKIGFIGPGGHSTRIRMIPRTNIIEYYEPNFGTFFFYERESFVTFFTLMMNTYKRSGMFFNKFFFYVIGENKAPAQVPAPLTADKTGRQNLDRDLFQSIKSTTESLSFLKYDLNEYHMTEKDLRICCYDNVVNTLDLVQDQGTLAKISEFFSAVNYDNAFLFKTPDKNIPHEELLAIRSAIDKKIAALQKGLELPDENLISQAKYIKQPLFFNKTGKSINEFKMDSLKLLDDIILKLEKISGQTQCHASKSASLTLLASIKKMKDIRDKTKFNPDILKSYLLQLHKEVDELSVVYKKDNQSDWTKDNPKTKEEINLVIREVRESINNFIKDYGSSTLVYSSKVLGLSNDERIDADKQKLKDIVAAMRASPTNPGFLSSINNASSGFFGSPLFPNATIPEQLQKIIDTPYASYQELENEVHRVNKNIINYHVGTFSKLLDDFFKEHLGYQDYSREDSVVFSSEAEENLANAQQPGHQ